MQIKPDAKEKAQKAKRLTATILENLAKRQPIKVDELKAEEVFRGLSDEDGK